VVAFAVAILFDTIKGCLTGTPLENGLMFGALLFTIMTLPSLYVIITSMT
jgi:hypothetical protein